MGILGLILSNNQVVWEKDHPVIRKIEESYEADLNANRILTIPVLESGAWHRFSRILSTFDAFARCTERFRRALCFAI